MWAKGAAPARRCLRQEEHDGGPGGRVRVGAEPRVGAALRHPRHSPPHQAGLPALRLAEQHWAPQLRQTAPGHCGRRARLGPKCGQRRKATGRGPPPAGHTDTSRDTRGHAHMHTQNTPTVTGHTEERARRKETQANGQNTGREGSRVNHLSATQPRDLSPQEHLKNLPTPYSSQPLLDHFQPENSLPHREVVLIWKTPEQAVRVPGPASSHPPPPSPPIYGS